MTCILLFVPDQNDFTQVGVFQGFTSFLPSLPGTTRRNCFNIAITDDTIYEDEESFTVVLFFNILFPTQSGIEIRPNVTEIFINDEDGNACNNNYCIFFLHIIMQV